MSTPTAQIQQWLTDFGSAVARGEFGKATTMFGPDDSYWRDLVSFSWNIKTAEGPQQIQAMLEATMPNARPSNFTIQGEGSEANGVDAADHAAGAQGLRGKEAREPRQGRRARRVQRPQDVARVAPGRGAHARLREAAVRGGDRRRAGRHHPRRAAAQARGAGCHRREERAARRQLAQPLQEPVS